MLIKCGKSQCIYLDLTEDLLLSIFAMLPYPTNQIRQAVADSKWKHYLNP